LKFLVLQFLVLKAFLKELESFFKERERIGCVGRVLKGFDVASERLGGIAKKLSTCNSFGVSQQFAGACLDCPHRNFPRWGCASKKGGRKKREELWFV
jgi:hypothetical protein